MLRTIQWGPYARRGC